MLGKSGNSSDLVVEGCEGGGSLFLCQLRKCQRHLAYEIQSKHILN